MGDRRIAEIRMAKGSLCLYTHWGGHELPEMAAAAIEKARPRWDDEPYAARILVDQLTKSARDQETGFGLLLEPDAEDEYNADQPSVIIDLVKQELTIWDNGNATVRSFQVAVKEFLRGGYPVVRKNRTTENACEMHPAPPTGQQYRDTAMHQ